MTNGSTLRLDQLDLRNFRCFAECSIKLHPDLTVLVAENGRGKTALLDAVGIALGFFVDTIAGTRQSHGFYRTDVRMEHDGRGRMTPVLPTAFNAQGLVDNQQLTWSRTLNGYSERARTTTKDAAALREAAQRIRQSLGPEAAAPRDDAQPLPLVAFYGTGRLWSEHRLTEGKRTAPAVIGRFSAYTDCLSSSSSFKSFVDWYEATANAVRDPSSRAFGPEEQPLKLLTAVREATGTVLEPTGWQVLDWDFDNHTLVVEHADGSRLPLSLLSDGVRNMIALVGDLAHRCARLNPRLGESAARLTPGILLIDELDMHLHPGWQQLVVELLQRAFPQMQIVLTTHSPHVLSTVDKESIRVIRLQGGQGFLDTPTYQTRGVQSADVLGAIMQIDPIPRVAEARWLSDYRALIEDGKAQEDHARSLREHLIAHFGPDHPLILDCDRLIRFQSFKLRRSPGEGA